MGLIKVSVFLLLMLVVATFASPNARSGPIPDATGPIPQQHEEASTLRLLPDNSATASHVDTNLGTLIDPRSRSSNGVSEWNQAHKNREVRSGVTISVPLNAAMTNETLQTSLCNTISNYQDGAVNTIQLTSAVTPTLLPLYFTLPNCLATYTNITSIIAVKLLITNFSAFPASLTSLSVNYAKLAYVSASAPSAATPSAAATSGSGINEDGTVNWTEVFASLPAVTSFLLVYSDMRGSLPESLPPNMSTFSVFSNQLTGTIPATLFNRSSAPLIGVSFNNNQLSGPIPAALFQALSGKTFSVISFLAQNNRLNGSIPAYLFLTLGGIFTSSFTLQLDYNNLSGSIPSSFFPSGFLDSYLKSLVFTASFNALAGSWPSDMLQYVTSFTSLSIDVSSNNLSGSLPDRLFANIWTSSGGGTSISLALSNNSLSGTISSALLTGGLSASSSLNILSLRLENNKLYGSVPSSLFTSLDGNNRTLGISSTLLVNLGMNQLTGALPSSFFNNAFISTISSTYLALNNNPLTGSVPDDLWGSVPAGSSVLLNLAVTSVSGPLPTFCQVKSTSYNFSNTGFTGNLPVEWESCKLLVIDVSSTSVNGSISSSLLSKTVSFYAANSAITGTLPYVGAAIQSLVLTNTSIDFCGSFSNATSSASSLSTCSFANTTACGCQSSFRAVCVSTCPVPAAPVACSGTPPSSDFTCVNGIWTASTTTAPALVIPSGSGTVVVVGNITSTSIVFHDVGTTIEIGGCATNLTHITIELTTTQVESLDPATLHALLTMSSSDASCTNLSTVTITASVTDSKCKKLKAQAAVTNESSTLGAYFTLDNSKCRTWWIILVSVICGVILIAIIVLVLLSIFSPAFRAKVRPFSSRRGPTNDQLK